MTIKTITILSLICLTTLNTELLNAQTNDFSKSTNAYSFDLYRETKAEKENIFLSPLSIYYALLSAYEGSKKKTKQEFEEVLYLKNSAALKNDYLHRFANKSDSSGFNVFNAIWLDKGFEVEESYRKSVSNKYLSDFEQTDFAHTETALSNINGWVSEKTKQRINEIISDENIDASTKLVLTNAVYLKGEWLTKFDKQKTVSAPFFTSLENQYKVDFMQKTESLPYFENDEYQFISKPYKGSDLSFCILLPKKLFGIDDLEKKMNAAFFNELLDSTYSIKTALSLPKLNLESNYELSAILKNIGLKTAFTGEANFSGITNEVPLTLGQVLHKTWIELDEEKTEAAAATAAPIMIGSARMASFKVFKADHPFVFFVIDNQSGAILFMGRYILPTNGERIEEESLTQNLEKRKQEKFAVGKAGNGVLIILDKKIISQAKLQAINPQDIESMDVIKDKDEIAKYTSKNYDGVILVKLKKKRWNKRKNK